MKKHEASVAEIVRRGGDAEKVRRANAFIWTAV
jgi:hypothetical protein